jgi:hypothetical protein
MITLKKYQENSLKVFVFKPGIKSLSTCLPVGIEIVPPISTTATFGFASSYTEVLQGGTISMPTGRNVDNL